MAGIQLERNTKWMLEQWGIWASSKSEFAKLGYPSIQPYTRLSKSTKGPYLSLDEEKILEVDYALARLKSRDKPMSEATNLYYCFKGNTSRVARELGIDRKKIDVLVAAGTAWVDAVLSITSISD